ncbi:MAG: alpha/beta fold hydrolase [Gammaproteobacteria bacterium]|nr:alpha/beta fold hydrolase [Gammaproteobacteria bacterium]
MTYSPQTVERQTLALGDFVLENGEAIQNFELSYIVHGTPASDGSNVILVTSSLAGDAHRLDFLIGEGLAFDPSQYCVIATDAIGNGWSSSPSNSKEQPAMAFPQFGIRDMVESQRRLLQERFDLDQILAVAGASMGGMQALQWAVSHPTTMSTIIALVPLARTPAWTVISNETSRRILMLDPAWNNGNYDAQPENGWRTCAAFTQGLGICTPIDLDTLFPTTTGCLDWLKDIEDKFMAKGFDANDWIYQTRAYDAHNVGEIPPFNGHTQQALASIEAKTLIMGPDLDLLNPAEQQQEIAKQIPNAHYVPIPSIRGHLAASPGDLADISLINSEVTRFLNH